MTPIGNKVLCFKEAVYFLDKERGDKTLLNEWLQAATDLFFS